MSKSDSLLVKLRKYCFVMNQSDSLLVKLRKHYFLSFVAGAIGGFAGGFIHAVQHSQSPQVVIIGAIITGISYSSAEVVILLGNTWWQRGLLWVTTMIVIINLSYLLIPSVDFVSPVGLLPSSLLNYVHRKLNQKFSAHKKR